jgi:hypothetical protein
VPQADDSNVCYLELQYVVHRSEVVRVVTLASRAKPWPTKWAFSSGFRTGASHVSYGWRLLTG